MHWSMDDCVDFVRGHWFGHVMTGSYKLVRCASMVSVYHVLWGLRVKEDDAARAQANAQMHR